MLKNKTKVKRGTDLQSVFKPIHYRWLHRSPVTTRSKTTGAVTGFGVYPKLPKIREGFQKAWTYQVCTQRRHDFHVGKRATNLFFLVYETGFSINCIY